MEQEQSELPEATFDPVQTANIYLEGCPHLGLRSDPSTSLGFPNEANQCHRLGKPAGIELAHQSGYCLSRQYKSCYIYVRADVKAPSAESNKARFSLALPALALPSLEPHLAALKPRLVALKPRKDPLKLRLLSLKLSLLLFKLRLLSLLPSHASLKQSLPRLEQNLPKLKQNFQSLNLDVDALKNRMPSAKISQALNRFNVQSLTQQNVRLLALPLMLLLILAAAIIWWPPLGESEQDAVVMGASIVNEATGSSLEVRPDSASSAAKYRSQSERDAVLLVEPAALAAEKDVIVGDDQEGPAASSDTLTLVSPAAGDSNAAEEGLVEALPEPSNSVAVVGESAPETTVVGDEAAVELQQTEAEIVGRDGQEEVQGAIAPEQLEQVEAESVDAVESDVQVPDDAPQTATASNILPVAAIASIGPSANKQSLQELYESPPPLYVHFAPGDGTEVVAMITEQQPATIFGRDSSGEWLLVRLARGIEGWVNFEESGADIIVSNLPAVDNGALAVTEPLAVAAESPASEAGALPVLATAVVNIGALNVRSGPGLDYDSIGIVYNKQQVSLLEQPGSDVWIQVRLTDGLQGWLNSNYLILVS